MPPDELQQKLFPKLEQTEAMNNAKPEKDQDIATTCFMNLLRWFRVVILQDAVFLRKRYPALKIWLEPVFNNLAFERFTEELLHEAECGETPQHVRIHRAMPDLAYQLREQHANSMNTMSTNYQSLVSGNKQEHFVTRDITRQEHTLTRDIIIQNLQPILSVLADLTGSGIMLHAQTSAETHVQLVGSGTGSAVMQNSNLNSSPCRTSLNQSNSITSTNTTTNTTSRPSPNGVHLSAMLMDSNHVPPSVEQYRLASHVHTMVDLWREYTVGVPHRAGALPAPSIQQLDQQFGPKWRTRDDCRKAYSRRRHIWEAVQQASENLNFPPEIVAEKVDRWRQNHEYTLNRLNSVLAVSRKSGANVRQSGLWGDKDVELLGVI